MALSILALLLMVFYAVPSRASNQEAPETTPVRAVDAVCARCHQEIYHNYVTTPMANSSGPAVERLIPGEYEHKTAGVNYSIEKVNGKAVLSWRDVRSSSASGQRKLSYFLGSGHLGTTWLYSVGPYLFESPVAWYSASRSYDMKPGLANAKQMLPALPMESDCMRCHMSAVQPSVPGSINRYAGLPFLHGGITCEACHGDTRQHVLSGGKLPVVNPAKLSPDKRDSLCISCHLEADITVERAGRSMLNFRPGDSISDFLAYYVYAKSDPLARGVSEVEQFNTSMCKRVSGDRMSCTSCHDPHFTPAPSQRVAFFRSKCLVCHGAPIFVKTHHPENQDCVGCHMPHNGAQNIPHVAWTDHRILKHPQPDNSEDDESTNVLKPIFSPAANTRDLGMAYYLAYLKGNRDEGVKALSLLSSQQKEIQNDAAALDALGLLSLQKGDFQAGQSDFERVLSLDPKDLTALSNLGALLAKEGKLDQSLQLLRDAFSRNQDVAGLAMNLARVECAMGDAHGVQSTLKTSLLYNPGVEELQQFLNVSLTSCRAPAQNGGAN